jgi:sortase B
VVEGVETEVPSVDFDALKQYNSEIVGWIQIPDTVINYAVPQHSDNEFYLDHALDQSYNQYGSIFMDCNSDPTLADYNTVIYGHHLQNGEEFAKIADYSSQSEFDTLTYIYYVTEDGTVHVLSPLCAMVVNGYDVDSIRTSFSDKQDFAQYVSSTLARSSAKTSKTVTSEITHLYMLSTCSYANDNDRTILVCVDASVFGEAASEGTNDAVASIEQGVSSVTGVENSDESTQNAEAGQAQVTA